MCCYMVNDGIDQCCIGYLRHYCTKFNNYNSTFIQVVDFIAPSDADHQEQNFIAFMDGQRWPLLE